MNNVGILGYGNMGSAIYNSIKGKFNVFVHDPYKIDDSIKLETDFNQFISNSEIVIICIKPQIIPDTLKRIKEEKIIFSIAAGVKLDTLKNLLPENSKIVRLMPNLPLIVNRGCIGYIGDKSVYAHVDSIFGSMGYILEVSNESLIDSITALSGSGPAYVFSFIHSLAEGGVKCGLPYKDALELSIHTVLGSAEYLLKELQDKTSNHPYELRNKVTSPGGTTIFGLDALEKENFNYATMNAVYSAYLRAKDLEK